jgi:hypothetical protein
MQGVICIIEVRGRAILTSVDDLIDWMIGIRARLSLGHCHGSIRGPWAGRRKRRAYWTRKRRLMSHEDSTQVRQSLWPRLQYREHRGDHPKTHVIREQTNRQARQDRRWGPIDVPLRSATRTRCRQGLEFGHDIDTKSARPAAEFGAREARLAAVEYGKMERSEGYRWEEKGERDRTGG